MTKELTAAFAQFLSAAVFGIALTALLGHAINDPTLYTWKGVGATAIPTAMMNLLQAAALFLLASRDETN